MDQGPGEEPLPEWPKTMTDPTQAPPPSLQPVWSSPPPVRSRPAWITAVAALVVIGLIVGLTAFLVLRDGDGSTGVGPTPSPTMTAAGSSPTPSGSPTQTGSSSPSPSASTGPFSSAEAAQLAREIAEVEAQVPPIRGLQPTEEVPKRFLDEAGLKAALRESFDEDNPAAIVRAFEDLYKHLGLLPADSDLRGLILDLQGSSVAGFYDPDTDAMTIVQRDAAFGPLEKVTLAHEFTHALQDQHFTLDSFGLDEVAEGDRGLGRLALIEGDATLVMSLWARRHLTPDEILEMVQQSNDPAAQAVLARMPPILLRQTLFPYTDGLTFVSGIFQQGGFDAVDEAFAKPPDSTEQILHPERYAAGEKPVAVGLPAVTEALGSGWTETTTDTMGELNVQIWLQQDQGASASRRAAEGWGGDRIGAYLGPDDAWAVAWQTAWDTPSDAAEFAAGAREVIGGLEGESDLLTGAGSETVIVLLASDAATLDRLQAAFRQPG
jgi:hypothetical protein